MATFKIHEDDENSYPSLSSKLKELGPIQPKRSGLRILDNNTVEPRGNKSSKPSGEADVENCGAETKGNSDKSHALLTKENPIAVGKKNVSEATCQFYKSVFSEKHVTVREVTKCTTVDVHKENETVKVESTTNVCEKAVCRSPLKEIEHFKNDKFEDKKIDSPICIDSPIASPDVPSSIGLELEDLYACVVYKDDIYKYLKNRETMFKPKPLYMKRQPDVTYTMRTILVDWLVEVGEEYKLNHQTLFLTVNFIDRFLSSMAVVRGKLQLLGTAAMFLASKFEEIYPPEVSEFTYITDDTYTKKQILRMEQLVLKVLDFNLSTPTTYTFIMHIAASTRMPEKVMFLSIYICELGLLEADPYLGYSPSIIACGAIALSRHCLGYVDVWPSYLNSSTGYTLKQLAPVIQHLNDTHSNSFTISQRAIAQKYKIAKYQCVSMVPHKKLSIRMES